MLKLQEFTRIILSKYSIGDVNAPVRTWSDLHQDTGLLSMIVNSEAYHNCMFSCFISQDEPFPMWDFFNRILEIAGKPPVTRYLSPRLAYLAGWACEKLFRLLPLEEEPPLTRFLAEELSVAHWFDISAAKADLGYRPRFTMEQGFDRFAAWWKGRGVYDSV